MKAQEELRIAVTNVAIVLNTNPERNKEELTKRLANLIATLEVFTDLNFTEEEQGKLFDLAAKRITELKEKVT
jgi:hypothetical protein